MRPGLQTDKKYISTSVPGLIRDLRSGAVINNNDSEYNTFMNERSRRAQQHNLAKKVDILEKSIEDIKQMLNILVTKNGN